MFYIHTGWCIFRRPSIARVVVYAKAAIALHNYLRTTESSVYCPQALLMMVQGTQLKGKGGHMTGLALAYILSPELAVTGKFC